MITDNQTNFLYIADCLPKKYPGFFHQLEQVLIKNDISFSLLPNTKDIWAVDYMPVQIEKNRFVQFVYNPDYLRNTIKWRKTIADVNKICESIHILTEKSKILIDGGNVIRSETKIIMCDKVFRENYQFSERQLIKYLEQIFQVDKIIFIPTDPDDFTGHADGLVRFYENDTVLINAAENKKNAFQLSLRLALHNAGLKYIEIPYNPFGNKKKSQANGIYLNYLQMQQVIIIPVFGIAEDDPAEKQFVDLFNGNKISTVNSNDIANEGGILNCISWNILQ